MDKARGVMFGQFIGDSLGARYEFLSLQAVTKTIANDRLKSGFLPILGGGQFQWSPGQVTDDGEMALSLSGSLITDHRYQQSTVATAYARWAQTQPRDIGQATATALRTSHPIPQNWYTTWNASHKEQVLMTICKNVEQNSASQSNGALMRISPLAVFLRSDLSQLRECASLDTSLTHNNAVVHEATQAYVVALFYLLNGSSNIEAYNKAMSTVSSHVIREHLRLAEKQRVPVPYGHCLEKKTVGDSSAIGYVGVALQIAFHELLHASSFEQGLINAILVGGDTDTNGAISGALLGARFGANSIPDDWKNCVLNFSQRIKNENGLRGLSLEEIISKITLLNVQ